MFSSQILLRVGLQVVEGNHYFPPDALNESYFKVQLTLPTLNTCTTRYGAQPACSAQPAHLCRHKSRWKVSGFSERNEVFF